MSQTYSTCPAKPSTGRAALSTREAAETTICKDSDMPERSALTSSSKRLRLRLLGVVPPSLRDLRLREGLCTPSSSESSGKSSDKSSSELASESGSGSFFKRKLTHAKLAKPHSTHVKRLPRFPLSVKVFCSSVIPYDNPLCPLTLAKQTRQILRPA